MTDRSIMRKREVLIKMIMIIVTITTRWAERHIDKERHFDKNNKLVRFIRV